MLVADPGAPGGASRAAAGLVNPVTGQRLTRAGDLETLLPATHRRLAAIGELLGEPVHTATPILRYLHGDRPQKAWPRRCGDPAYAPYLKAGPEPESVWIHGGALVDMAALLGGVRAWLRERGALVAEGVDPREIGEAASGLRWKGHTFGQAVFCQGAGLEGNPWFGSLPLAPVKGQVLEGRAPGLPPHPIHRAKTLVPLGGDRFRLGATYDRDGLPGEATAEGRQTLEGALPGLLRRPEQALITGHLTGMRPTTPDGLPLLGRSPMQARVVVFNGLGSKGLLLGPHYAECLARTLAEGEPVPPEADLERFGERQ